MGTAQHSRARKPRYPGNHKGSGATEAAEAQAAQDAAAELTAARPQHRTRRNRSTNGQGATFSFFVRERICEAHVEAHGIVRERVLKAKGQGKAASLEGLTAELRAVSDARRYVAASTEAQRPSRMKEIRRCLLAVAASAILLAEAADRPDRELARGEKSSARQWFTPNFYIEASA